MRIVKKKMKSRKASRDPWYLDILYREKSFIRGLFSTNFSKKTKSRCVRYCTVIVLYLLSLYLLIYCTYFYIFLVEKQIILLRKKLLNQRKINILCIHFNGICFE